MVSEDSTSSVKVVPIRGLIKICMAVQGQHHVQSALVNVTVSLVSLYLKSLARGAACRGKVSSNWKRVPAGKCCSIGSLL
jgi:hypothetical protein